MLASIAEEMDATLERAAYSPNSKDGLNHSCAERCLNAPLGANGGGNGSTNKDSLQSPDKAMKGISGKFSANVSAQSIIQAQSPGKGGFNSEQL